MLLMFLGSVPAAVLRWVILRRPLSFLPAACMALAILVSGTAIWHALGGGGSGGQIIGGATALSFFYLWRFGSFSFRATESSEDVASQVERPRDRGQATAPPPPPDRSASDVNTQGSTMAGSLSPTSIEYRLAEARRLFEKGLITESEYGDAKQRLLQEL